MQGRCPVSCWHGMAAARAGKRGQSLTIQQPVTFANGMADGCRLTGGRAVSLTDGVRMAGRVSLLTGSWFLGARSLIIPFRTGAARQAGGVIRSGVLAVSDPEADNLATGWAARPSLRLLGRP